MNKKFKIIAVCCLSLTVTAPIYAQTEIVLSGTSSSTELCKKLGINDMPMSLQVTMPSTASDMPVINSTQGFTFKYPNLIRFNKEGVQNNCDYNLPGGNPILINNQLFFVQRMVIFSQFNDDPNNPACIHTSGELDIAPRPSSSNKDICIVPLAGND